MGRCRRSTATRTPSRATIANARDNGAEVTAWEADALADERARGRRCSSRTSSSSCSSRCSRAASPGRGVIVSGLLEAERFAPAGYTRRDRATADGWQALLLERG